MATDELPTPTFHWKAGDPLPEGWHFGEGFEPSEVITFAAGALKISPGDENYRDPLNRWLVTLMDKHGVAHQLVYEKQPPEHCVAVRADVVGGPRGVQCVTYAPDGSVASHKLDGASQSRSRAAISRVRRKLISRSSLP